MIEIWETKERKLIKEVLTEYSKWEQSEISDIDFFKAVKDIGNTGIELIQETEITTQAERYLDDLETQKIDNDDLEYIDIEVEQEIKDIKEVRKIA